ncbi:14645_t:CDS:2 [Funneliformis geosporum]|uniref:1349_t:CDS:1 n=1 Tax=Funneliformis geosporum TaxID=1117311 RepID=A0A9W4SVC7_9GLOM|nr:14645_t:CDS:2 [Funneliformis geosporum]CAI2184675.1 1349_t:CDS:2 [Funneliformis geosporum]
MKINAEGLELVKDFEGFRADFYNDLAGHKTIGYGHNCDADPNKCKDIKAPITQAQAEELLKTDLAKFEGHVTSLVKVKLNSNQFSALVSFTFNLGQGNLASSTLLKKLNAGDYEGASKEFGKWVYAAKKVVKGLERRREAERALFVKA